MIIHTKSFIQTKQCQASHFLLSQGDRELRSDIRCFVKNKKILRGPTLYDAASLSYEPYLRSCKEFSCFGTMLNNFVKFFLTLLWQQKQTLTGTAIWYYLPTNHLVIELECFVPSKIDPCSLLKNPRRNRKFYLWADYFCAASRSFGKIIAHSNYFDNILKWQIYQHFTWLMIFKPCLHIFASNLKKLPPPKMIFYKVALVSSFIRDNCIRHEPDSNVEIKRSRCWIQLDL